MAKKKRFRLIFASSSEIYGDKHADILKEDMPLNYSIIQPNDYAVTKWVNEIQIMNFEKRFGIEAVRCRFLMPMVPENITTIIEVLFACFVTGHCLVFLKFTKDTIGFLCILMILFQLLQMYAKNLLREVYNIGGKEFRSVKELSNLILDYTGADPNLVEYLPEDKHNVLSKRPDIEKAMKLFGHDPQVTLEEGVPKTIEWMKSVYGS